MYDGFGTRNTVLASQSRIDIAGFQLFDAGEIIGLRTVAAYLDVLRNRQLVELADANAAKDEEVLGQIRTRADAGAGSQADVNQAEGRVALANSTLLATLNGLRDSEAAYLESVYEPPRGLNVPQIDAGQIEPNGSDATGSGAGGSAGVTIKDRRLRRG